MARCKGECMTPKVSIVVPVYNVEQYLPECLESLASQTLKDIEIILVNDGSTDGSLDILKQYASNDSRFTIVDKANAGYGHSMNRGFERARGEYIGIVESDDCARPEMFEKLYEQAKKNDADIVRSNYFTMGNCGTEFHLVDVLNLSHAPYYMAFDPKDYPDVFRGSPAIWTAIYRRDFIFDNGISFLESPGASYQDTGFFLKVLSAAQKVVFVREAYLNYRIDNAGSSVKSGSKVFCVCDEYESFDEFLSRIPERANTFRFIIQAKKYETYIWNYNRLDDSLRPVFLERMAAEFLRARSEGDLKEELFQPIEWQELNSVIDNPSSFSGKSFTVVPVNLDTVEYQKSRCANGEISRLRFLLWRIKHGLKR